MQTQVVLQNGVNAMGYQSITDNSHNVAVCYQAGKDINAIIYSNIIGSDALGSTTADISCVNALASNNARS